MFNIGGDNINTIVTSKEEILKVCREIVSESGLSAVNMRAVAQRCHIALGSLYYYFSGKDELVLETIESVWKDIFQMDRDKQSQSFTETVEWIFESVRNGANAYPNFFTAHSLSFASTGKSKANSTMDAYIEHMKAGMSAALKADRDVRTDAFSEAFSEADLLDFVLTNILVLLLRQKQDCRFLIEIVRKTIY